MADNITLPLTGSGDATAAVAADEIAGVKHQRVKVEYGTDGSATDVSASNPMPVTVVTVQTNPLPVAIDELTTADLDTGAGTDTRAVIALVYGHSGGGVLVSDTNPLPVVYTPATSSTPTVTQVPAAITSTTILALNASRKGASVFNDSTAELYLKMGTSGAAGTSFTIKLPAYGYYEPPAIYTGGLVGAWASATGNAYVTELT
jgi:hypothetical protein